MEVKHVSFISGTHEFRVETNGGWLVVGLFPSQGKVFFSYQQGSLTIDSLPSLFERGKNDQIFLSQEGKDVFGFCHCGERATARIPLGWDSKRNMPAHEPGCAECYGAAMGGNG